MKKEFNINDIPDVHIYDQRRVETKIKFPYLKKHFPKYLFDAKELFAKHMPDILNGLNGKHRILLTKHGYNPNFFTRIIKKNTELTILDLHMFASMLDCSLNISFTPNKETLNHDNTTIQTDTDTNSDTGHSDNNAIHSIPDPQDSPTARKKYSYNGSKRSKTIKEK